MLEKYFTDCSCSLEVHLQLMVKAVRQGSCWICWDREVEYLQDIHEVCCPHFSIFHVITYLRSSCQKKIVSPASGYLLSNSFIWTIPQHVRATPAACASWLWLSASKLLQKIKANRHCLWPVRTSSQCSPSNQLNRKIRSYYCKIIYLPC